MDRSTSTTSSEQPEALIQDLWIPNITGLRNDFGHRHHNNRIRQFFWNSLRSFVTAEELWIWQSQKSPIPARLLQHSKGNQMRGSHRTLHQDGHRVCVVENTLGNSVGIYMRESGHSGGNQATVFNRRSKSCFRRIQI